MRNLPITFKLFTTVFTLLYLLPNLSSAQFRSSIDVQEWPEGRIILTSGDVLEGPVTYYRQQDIINVTHEDGTITSLTPVNVEEFVLKEMPTGLPHLFKTYRWDLGKDYTDFKKPTFFEQLSEGKLSIISRETYLTHDISHAGNLRPSGNYYDNTALSAGDGWIERVKRLYYVLLPDGDIVTLRNVRKDLFKLFGKKAPKVKEFIKVNNLGYEKPHELVAIVNYYNSLP